MNSNHAGHENTPPENERRSAFITSALAGGGFGVVVGTVFLLMGIVEYPPLPFLGGLTLLTAGVSALAGLAGAVLDDWLKSCGVESHATRSLINFVIIIGMTFGASALIITGIGLEEIAPTLQQYALPGMFLGLVFGIAVLLINYRLWTVQQKVRILEIENRYLAELGQKDQLLQEAARNLAVAEERNSMARELHDSISQGIHGIVYSLHSLRRQLGEDTRASELLTHLEETTQATQQELRRLIMELTPSPLEDNNLAEALRLHCDLFSRRQQIEVDLTINYEGQLEPDQEVAVYRIVQEALANIQKHAGAKHVRLSLVAEKEQTRLLIADDGQGFAQETVDKGRGLANMAARARQNNGEFKLESAPGKGTAIEVTFAKVAF